MGLSLEKKLNSSGADIWNIDRVAYKNQGFIIVDDFLPQELAEQVYQAYTAAQGWTYHEQVRPDHYKHVFNTPQDSYFPKGDEPYLAKFWRDESLEASQTIKNAFDTYFKPAMKTITGIELSVYDNRCYKLDKGEYYRAHIDQYAGEIGCIYYLNKGWIWDWGGILNVGLDERGSAVNPIFPKFNRALFLDHGGFRFPHFISPVCDYAKEPRFTMVSFNK